MTLFLGPEHVRACVDQALAYGAIEIACRSERDGTVELPARVDVPTPRGFVRVMPAVLGDVMGLKVMTLVEGVGTRYLVVLCDVETGAVRALVDADELTRFRTGATTAMAARLLVEPAPRRIGLVGSGFEAVGQLRALAWLWSLDEAHVFSPNAGHREAFAAAMTRELGFPVRPVTSAKAAVADQDVVVLATKARAPVVDGGEFRPRATVLSIGSTRPDLRELDEETLARAVSVVGDDRAQVLSESGDILAALAAGVLDPGRVVAMASVWAGCAPPTPDDGHDLMVFKSVGTALQDLAIARAVVDRAASIGDGAAVELGDIATLKPFVQGA